MQQRWPRHVILRCGPLYGPLPLAPLECTPFLQAADAALSAQVHCMGALAVMLHHSNMPRAAHVCNA